MKSPSVRVCAALALADVLQNGSSLASVIPKYSEGLSAQDQALMQELCFGVCRYFHRMALIAAEFLQKPFKKKDSDIEALVYLGIYQLLFTRIPDHAAISATVDAAIAVKKVWAKGLLNAVLRNVQRAGETIAQRWSNNESYLFSHPEWFVAKVKLAWPERWQTLLLANNEHPPMTLRVNTRLTSRDGYLAQLTDANIEATSTHHSLDGIQLTKAYSVKDFPRFSDGFASVQDESAQLAAQLLDLAPGQRVLDACCAPGGKTCHILEKETRLAEVVALDLEASRMVRVEENLARLGLKATLKVADAADLNAWWDQKPFNRILLDAPCSATGVIRRHPDIKLLRRASDIGELAKLQSALLATLWQTLAPDGLLVYATCSVLPDENEAIVKRFVEQTTDAEHLPIKADWGLPRPYGRQLFPNPRGGDGFFYAVLRKVSQS